MSRLKELINEFCPGEVEYLTIKKIAQVGTGSSNGNEADEKGEFPFFIRSKKIKYKNDFEYDDESIIIPGEGGIGDIYHYVNGKYAIHQRVYRINFINNGVNVKFAFYYFSTYFKQFILSKAVSATVKSIRKPMIEDFKIPLPPLPVQEEIVRILDSFTEKNTQLIEVLKSEITARKKQYEWYREILFNSDSAKKVSLGDEKIGYFTRGSGLQKKDFTDTGVGCIHYGQIYTYYNHFACETKSFVSFELAKKARKAKYGDLVIATTSENDEDVCKAVAWLGEEEIAISSDACFYRHNLHPKFISYFFQTEQFQKQKRNYITGTKVRRVNVNNLEKIKIPLIPTLKQQQIVDILDRYTETHNEAIESINIEIKMREQQYEHYRDRLLTFKELEV